MGMFDWYEPGPELATCPVCGSPLYGWQGKDADNPLLLVWRQGERAPVDQRMDDEYCLYIEDRDALRLPERFLIHTACLADHRHMAEGRCVDGVWLTSAFIAPGSHRG
jgi:hypothetical protein